LGLLFFWAPEKSVSYVMAGLGALAGRMGVLARTFVVLNAAAVVGTVALRHRPAEDHMVGVKPTRPAHPKIAVQDCQPQHGDPHNSRQIAPAEGDMKFRIVIADS